MRRARRGRPSLPSAPLALVALLLAAAPAAGESTWLPELFLHLKGAHYAPTEPAREWTGWIGGGAGLLRVLETTGYLRADVETLLGSESFHFQATQSNYQLEAGAHRGLGRGDAALFFHHVSRHQVDSAKQAKVDWNLVGGRFTLPVRDSASLPVWASASLGWVVLASFVDYRWEATLRVDADVLPRAWGGAFASANARLVGTRVGPPYARSSFADWGGEAGLRRSHGGRSVEVFVAYEHRSDVELQVPGSRERALFGLRIRGHEGPEGRGSEAAQHGPWHAK